MVISFDANNIDTYMARGDAYTRLVRVLSKRPSREAEFIAAKPSMPACSALLRERLAVISFALKSGPLAYTSDAAGIRCILENARSTVSHKPASNVVFNAKQHVRQT
jgi:hypothetical protein